MAIPIDNLVNTKVGPGNSTAVTEDPRLDIPPTFFRVVIPDDSTVLNPSRIWDVPHPYFTLGPNYHVLTVMMFILFGEASITSYTSVGSAIEVTTQVSPMDVDD